MSKSYLKQILTYINKVYDIGEKINTLKDKRKISSKNFNNYLCCFIWIYASNKEF